MVTPSDQDPAFSISHPLGVADLIGVTHSKLKTCAKFLKSISRDFQPSWVCARWGFGPMGHGLHGPTSTDGACRRSAVQRVLQC